MAPADKKKQSRWIDVEPGDWGNNSILQVGQVLTSPTDPSTALLRREGPFDGFRDIADAIRREGGLDYAGPGSRIRADHQTGVLDPRWGTANSEKMRDLLGVGGTMVLIPTTTETIYATHEFVEYILGQSEISQWRNGSSLVNFMKPLFLVTKVRKLEYNGNKGLHVTAVSAEVGMPYTTETTEAMGFIGSYMVDQITFSDDDGAPRLDPWTPGNPVPDRDSMSPVKGTSTSRLRKLFHRSSKTPKSQLSEEGQPVDSFGDLHGQSIIPKIAFPTPSENERSSNETSTRIELGRIATLPRGRLRSSSAPAEDSSEATQSQLSAEIPRSGSLFPEHNSRPQSNVTTDRVALSSDENYHPSFVKPSHDSPSPTPSSLVDQQSYHSTTLREHGAARLKEISPGGLVSPYIPRAVGVSEASHSNQAVNVPPFTPHQQNAASNIHRFSDSGSETRLSLETAPTTVASNRAQDNSIMVSGPVVEFVADPVIGLNIVGPTRILDPSDRLVSSATSSREEFDDSESEHPQSPASKWHETVFDSVRIQSVNNTLIAQKEADTWLKSKSCMGKVNNFMSLHRKLPQRPKYIVKVAVLDTGIELDHPSLKGYLGKQQVAQAWCADFVTGEVPMRDSTGHGTHCAHTVLQVCKTARIYVAKVFDSDQGDESAVERIIKAIDWAVKNGVDIISMSFAFTNEHVGLRKAIISAIVQRDILFFAAASNDRHYDNDPVGFPATMDEVIRVNSCKYNGSQSDFSPDSDYKRDNALSTIGEEIEAAFPSKWNNGVASKRLSGTSMSTAILAGVGALLIEFAKLQELPPGVISHMESRLRRREGMKAVLYHCMTGLKPPEAPKYSYIRPWFLFTTEREYNAIVQQINHALDRGL